MKANKRIILLAALVVSSFVANAQSEQWKAYWDIRKQSRADMTPCEKMELCARIDSLLDGHIPLRPCSNFIALTNTLW